MKKRNVLLLGKGGIDAAEMETQLSTSDFQLYGGGSIDDVRSTFSNTKVDHVIMGGGLPLQVRLEIVGEIFRLSNTTPVHLKDLDSGPEGYLPFVRSVLAGLATLPQTK